MSCLFKCIFNSYQIYTIFFGFSYAYVNIEKRLVKFYILAKIYVTFINIFYTVILLIYLTSHLRSILTFLTGDNAVMYIGFLIENCTRVFLMVGLFVLRIKEERNFKKIYLSQLKYIDQKLHTTTDKTTEIIQVLYIIILFIHGGITLYEIISNLIYFNSKLFILKVSVTTFLAMELNIMFHHCLILSYIHNIFCKINSQLESEEITEILSDTYFKMSLLLKYVNTINCPLIFGVLISQFIAIAGYIYTIYLVIIKSYIYLHGGLTICILILVISFNIVLYFLMCDRFCNTIRKTGEILKEYNVKNHSYEVSL